MWTWIIHIVLSIVILWIGHCLWNYFLNQFSKQKKRDLLNIHMEKYKTIIQDLSDRIQEKNTKNTKNSQIEEPCEPITQSDVEKDLEQFVQHHLGTI